MNQRPSLRRIVKEATGQDVSKCQACFDCDVSIEDELDIPLGSLIQLVLQNDEEALQSRTLWSDAVMDASHNICKRGLDLYAVMTVLRKEAKIRGGG